MKVKLLIFIIFFSQLFYSQKNETLIEQELNHHKEMGMFKNTALSFFDNFRQIIKDKDRFVELNIQPQIIREIIENKSAFISINLPFFENSSKIILLKKRKLFSEDLKLIEQTVTGQTIKQLPNYVAYSGIVDNELENTMVSISFVNNTLRGLVSIGNKEYTIGPKHDKDNETDYILYEKSEVNLSLPQISCGVDDRQFIIPEQYKNESVNTIPKCITTHFEITKSQVEEWGGSSQSISKFISIFNSVQTIYVNDGLTLRVSFLKLWLTTSPYAENQGTQSGLDSFVALNSGVLQGNVGCLLGNFANGGVAWLVNDNNCDIRRNVCDVYSTFDIYPNYSWNVNVIAHEMGHNLGSPHTHSCVWNGNNTRIDNCGGHAGYTQGSCADIVDPPNGGTIMSYCHLVGVGINFNNGFGLQPRNLITNGVNNGICFTSCQDYQSCEDNIVSNVEVIDNSQSYTITWSSLYPVKIYRREGNVSQYTYLNTIVGSSYIVNHNNYCYNVEFKLVAVCPNGDSKPTVLIVNQNGETPPTASPLSIPFAENFNNTICQIGYTNTLGIIDSGPTSNNELKTISTGLGNNVVTRGFNLIAGEAVQIQYKFRKIATGSLFLYTKIGTDINPNNQVEINFTNVTNATFLQKIINYMPTVTGVYYLSFNCTFVNGTGVYIDDLSISSNRISIVGQNIGTPWETDIALTTTDGINYSKTNCIIPSGELKFRQNNNWTINWGGITNTGTFPSGTGIQDGYNIQAIVGTYNITIDRITGVYQFNPTLKLAENELNNLKIYPNPTNSIINILSPNETINQINVYDMLGRLLKSQKSNSENEKITIQDLPNAIYLLEVKTDKGSKTVKIVKE